MNYFKMAFMLGLLSTSVFAQRLIEGATEGAYNKPVTVLSESFVSVNTSVELRELVDSHSVAFAVPAQEFNAGIGGLMVDKNGNNGVSELKLDLLVKDQGRQGHLGITGGLGWTLYNHEHVAVGILFTAGLETGGDEEMEAKGGYGESNLGLKFFVIKPETKLMLEGKIEDRTYEKLIITYHDYEICTSINGGPQTCVTGQGRDKNTIKSRRQAAEIRASIEQDLFSKYFKVVANGSVLINSNGQLYDGQAYIGGKLAIVNDLIWLDAGVKLKSSQPKKPEFYIGVSIR